MSHFHQLQLIHHRARINSSDSRIEPLLKEACCCLLLLTIGNTTHFIDVYKCHCFSSYPALCTAVLLLLFTFIYISSCVYIYIYICTTIENILRKKWSSLISNCEWTIFSFIFYKPHIASYFQRMQSSCIRKIDIYSFECYGKTQNITFRLWAPINLVYCGAC